MKSRYLAVFTNDDGEPKCAMIETNDDSLLPGGCEAAITAELADRNLEYNAGANLILVEMPMAVDFRPVVFDAQADEEIETTFITI